MESTSLAAQALLNELVDEPDDTSPCADTVTAWRERYATAARMLREPGVAIELESREGEDEYVRLRSEWDAQLARLADAMLHRWPSSTPAPPG